MRIMGKREWGSDAERMAENRRGGRDQQPPAIGNRDRRDSLQDDDAGWLRTYLPSVFRFPFTSAHRYYIETIGECLRYGVSKCVAAPRGDGKSSICRYLALKYALYRQIKFPLLVCATGAKASKTLKSIKQALRSGPRTPLGQDFPLETHLARYIAPWPSRANNATAFSLPIKSEWSDEHVIIPQLADHAEAPQEMIDRWGLDRDSGLAGIVMALGWTSEQIQGCNVYDLRPDFVMLDDLDSRDSLASERGTVAEKIEAVIESNISGLVGMGERLGQVMLCTVPSRASVAFRYSDPQIKPAWSGVRVKRITSMPTDRELWSRYVDLRQKGKKTFGDDGKPIDVHGREAYQFYASNRAAMDAGADVSNPHDFDPKPTPDGTPTHLSALQKCYDFIADKSWEAFATEYQNDPPVDETEGRLTLTNYHIRANARSGHDRGVVPDDTIAVTCGADVQLAGLHTVTIAWSDAAVGSIIDFDFIPFDGTQGRPASACERLVLDGLQHWWSELQTHPWGQSDDKEGAGWLPDLTLIDSGWKDKEWGTQPVYLLAYQCGFKGIAPCKGDANFRPMLASKTCIPGDGFNLRLLDGVWLAVLDAAAWKLKVHSGFLQAQGTAGSLGLYTPPRDDNGREKWQRHQNYAGHILSEEWQRQPNGTYQWVPDGSRPGRKRPQKANHWLDATAYAIAARQIWGVQTVKPQPVKAEPVPQAAPIEREEPAASGGGSMGGRSRSW